MNKIFSKQIFYQDFGYEGLTVYRLSFQFAMDVFEVSKSFPKEERYSLTDQVRRSSRSISANIAEGYRKRIYPKSFISKMIDADGECSESMVHLKFAFASEYITQETLSYFEKNLVEIGKILNHMIQHPEKFFPKNNSSLNNIIPD